MPDKKDIVPNTNTELTLKRSNSLLDVTKDILKSSKRKDLLNSSDWQQVIIDWADNNGIDSSIIPRDKKELINLEVLDLSGRKLRELALLRFVESKPS